VIFQHEDVRECVYFHKLVFLLIFYVWCNFVYYFVREFFIVEFLYYFRVYIGTFMFYSFTCVYCEVGVNVCCIIIVVEDSFFQLSRLGVLDREFM